MKVALCFHGQPRLLDNPYTFLSHKHFIIDRYDTDVFVHTWISGEEKEFGYADQVGIKTKEDKNAKEKILQKYKPKKYIFEPPRIFKMESIRETLKQREIEYTSMINGSFNWSENNENNHFSQLYSLSKVISLLDGEKYDWVILSRYDNYIFNLPSLYQLEKDNLYIDNKWLATFSDVLIFGGQEQIETLNCYDKIPELCKEIYYFSPEEFKRVAYHQKYGKEKPPTAPKYDYPPGQEIRIDIGVGVVRTNTLEHLQI